MAEVLGSAVFKYSADVDTKQITSLISEIKKLAAAEGSLVKFSTNMAQNHGKVTATFYDAAQGANAASKSLYGYNNQLYHASFAFTALSASMLAMSAGFGKMIYDFDRNMTMVKAVSGATVAQFEEMKTQAREVGAATEFGAAKAAEGMLVLARIGVDAADSMKILTPAMQLAQSQQYDMAKATELVVMQMKVFNKTADESGKVADVLASGAAKTAGDLEMLSTSLAYAGPIASVLGRGLEETTAALGLMYNAGIKASTAGTNLRFGLQQLVKPTKQVKDGLKSIGLTIKDVDPTAHSLSEIMTTLADKLKGTSDKAKVLFNIFGVRAASGWAAMVQQVINNRDAFNDLQKEISESGEVAKQFDAQMNSLSGVLNLMKSGIEDMAIGFGQALYPELRLVAEGAKSMIDYFREMPDAVKGFIATGFGITAVTATIVGALSSVVYLGRMFSGIWVNFTGSIDKSIGSLRNAASGLKEFKDAQQRLATVMEWEAAGAVKRNLSNQLVLGTTSKLGKALAKEAIDAGMAAAANQKLATKKWEVFKATVMEHGALYRLDKAQIAEALSKGQQIMMANGYNAALREEVKLHGILAVSIGGVKKAMGGLFAAMGGWVGLSIMAITALVGWLIKMKAEAEEARRVLLQTYNDSIDKLEELSAAQKTAAKIQKDIAAEQAKSKPDQQVLTRLQEEMNEKKIEEREINRKLVELQPELLKGIDAETGALIVQNDILEEQIVKRDLLKSLMDNKSEKVKTAFDAYSKEVKAAPITKGAVSDIYENSTSDEYAGATTNETKLEVALRYQNEWFKAIAAIEKRKAELLQGKEDRWGTAGDKYVDNQVKKLTEEQKEYRESIVKVNRQIDMFKGAVKSTTPIVDEHIDTVTDAGSAVKALGQSYLDLEDKIKDLQDRVNKKSLSMETDIKLIDADEFGKEMVKLEQEYENGLAEIEGLSRNLAKVQEDVLASDNITAAQKVELNNMISNTQKFIGQSINISRDWYDAMASDAVSKYWNKMDLQRASYEVDMINTEMAIKETFDSVYDEKIMAAEAANAKEILLERQHLEDKQRELEAAKISTAGPVTKDQYEQDKKHIAELEQQVRESQTRIVVLKKLGFSEVQAIQYKNFQEQQDIDLQSFEAQTQNEMALLDFKRKQAREELQLLESKGIKSVKEHKASLDRMKVADRAYNQALIKTWHEMAGIIGGAISEVVGRIDKDMQQSIDNINRGISGVFDLAEGISSQNYLQAVGGALEVVLAAFNQNMDELAKEAEYIKKETDLRNDLNDSLKEFIASLDTYTLKIVDMIRKLTGLGTSEEDIIRTKSDISSRVGVIGAGRNVYGVNGLFGGAYGAGQRQAAYGESGQGNDYSAYGKPEMLLNAINDLVTAMKIPAGATPVVSVDPATGVSRTVGYKQGDKYTSMDDQISGVKSKYSEIDSNMWGDLQEMATTYSKGNINTEDLTAVLSDVGTMYNLGMAEYFTAPLSNLADLAADGNVTSEEIIDKLEEIRGNMEENAGRTVTLSNGEELPVVSGKDYVDVMNRIYAEQKALSEKVGGEEGVKILEDALEVKANMIEFAIKTFKDLTRSEQLDLLGALRDIDAEKAAVLEAFVKSVQESSKEVLDSLTSSKTEYDSDVSEITDKYKELRETWQGLLDDRDELTSSFEKDKAKLLSDSEERIGALKEEREAIVGNFNFSETQNQRSKRFAEARKVEKSILEEIATAEEKLNDMTIKFNESLDAVNSKLAELEIKYGSIYDMQLLANAELATAYAGFITQLTDMENKLESILGTSLQIVEAFKSGNLDAYLSGLSSDLTSGTQNVLRSDIGTTYAGPTQEGPTFNSPTSAPSDEMKLTSAQTARILGMSRTEAPVQTGASEQPAEGVWYQDGPFSASKTEYAAKGFSGMVNKPTRFMVGEAGPEMVNVSPVNDLHGLAKGIGGGGVTNIHLHESIDFRGAYGITSPNVAEKVYRDVWAPARRRNLGRYLSTKGKVIR